MYFESTTEEQQRKTSRESKLSFLLPLMHLELVSRIPYLYDTDTPRYFIVMKYPNLWSTNTCMMTIIYYFLLWQCLRNVILIWIRTNYIYVFIML